LENYLNGFYCLPKTNLTIELLSLEQIKNSKLTVEKK
jgi:hypothetical protein